MRWARGTGPLAVALGVAVAGVLLLAFSNTLNPVDALLGRGAVVDVPDVVGQAQPRALAELDEAGLRAELASAFSLSVPRGSVVAQDPEPGERVREGTVVEVVISQGVRRVEMPDAVGEQLEDVQGELVDAGIPIEVEQVVTESVPVGEVIAQEPGPGVVITAEDSVRFEVSAGPADRPVPAVVGRSVEAASFQLGVAGLVPGDIAFVDDPEVPQGAIVSTDPPEGEVVPIDTPVALVISAGPAPVALPNLVNRTETVARVELERLGFDVLIAGRLVTPDGGVGAVFGQFPEPGVGWRPGDPVTLVVGQRPPDPPPPLAPPTTTTTTTPDDDG